MDIHQLTIFEAVLATGNMTQAAGKLHLSPAAVSLQMRSLSAELNTELFSKAGKHLAPTPAAMRLARMTMQLLDILNQIRHDFEPDAESDTQPFIISTGVTPLIYRIGVPLRRFRRRYPHANIRVQVNSTPQTIAVLRERQADIGIVVLPFDARGIHYTPLYDEALKVCMNPKVFPIKGNILTISDLTRMPMILYAAHSSATRAIIDRLMSQLRVDLNIIMELDDTEGIKKMVELGFGASILPEHAVRRSALLKPMELQGQRLWRRIALATAETRYGRRLTEAFRQFLQAELAQPLNPD